MKQTSNGDIERIKSIINNTDYSKIKIVCVTKQGIERHYTDGRVSTDVLVDLLKGSNAVVTTHAYVSMYWGFMVYELIISFTPNVENPRIHWQLK